MERFLWEATIRRPKKHRLRSESRTAQLRSATRRCCLASRRTATDPAYFCRSSGYSCPRQALNSIRIESLLFPGITAHVVAVLLPEAGRIRLEELEAAHPLHRFPAIKVRDYQAKRISVLRLEWLSVVMRREQDVVRICSACTRTYCASDRGSASCVISPKATPSQ